jgi:KDO2-lipid IV(A) lauroyltransferase
MLGGHLGSFELLGYLFPFYGMPICALARSLGFPELDAWWNGRREGSGNTTLSRDGSFAEVLRLLKNGQNVGFVFDQNVRRPNAVFVDWFGIPAATTKAVALAGIRARSPIVVTNLFRLGLDRYRYEAEQVQTNDIYHNEKLSTEEKVFVITERATKIFEQMIIRHPEAWFWMHRRWKTRPNPDDPNPYADL